jgi:hypothetical protein
LDEVSGAARRVARRRGGVRAHGSRDGVVYFPDDEWFAEERFMTQHEDEAIDRRLAELASATDRIAATAGFTRRVMQAVRAEGLFREEILRSSWRLGPIAAVAAAIAVFWAVSSEHATDAVLATSDDAVELAW